MVLRTTPEAALLAVLLLAACGEMAQGPAPPSPANEVTSTEPTVRERPQVTANRAVVSLRIDLQGRGHEVLCPEDQEVQMAVTFLARTSRDARRTRQVSELCRVELPSFVVSAHGALGGCDETRHAAIDAGPAVIEATRPSVVEIAMADVEELPVSFVVGAELRDPFFEPLPDAWSPETFADDDADGQPGITLHARGVPLIDDGSELYAAVRLLFTPLAYGLVVADLDFGFAGSNTGLSGRTLARLAPRLELGAVLEYEQTEVAADSTCEELSD